MFTENMATAGTLSPHPAFSSPVIDMAMPSEPGSLVARRKRMEMRRNKMIGCSGPLAEHVSKRSREPSKVGRSRRPLHINPPKESAFEGLILSPLSRQKSLPLPPSQCTALPAVKQTSMGSEGEGQQLLERLSSGELSGKEGRKDRKKSRYRQGLRGGVTANGAGDYATDSSSSDSSSEDESSKESAGPALGGLAGSGGSIGRGGLGGGLGSSRLGGGGTGGLSQTGSMANEMAQVLRDMDMPREAPAVAPRAPLEVSPPPPEVFSYMPANPGVAEPLVSCCAGVPSGGLPADKPPPSGFMSICGRRREMEDAVALHPRLLNVPCGSVPGCQAEGFGKDAMCQLHFYGVYDGHGGSQAALHCSARLHYALSQNVKNAITPSSASSPPPLEGLWSTALTSAFLRMDAEISGLCFPATPHTCERTQEGEPCDHTPIAPETVGSTSVVAVVATHRIIVANSGDSRAVLARGGGAVALSNDHKPDREDEIRRVEAAGGRVIFWNGYRVLGVLAMSRAIGDRYLKPYILAEPEITFTPRSAEDECIIMASDGLWDVINNETACDIARGCLFNQEDKLAAVTKELAGSGVGIQALTGGAEAANRRPGEKLAATRAAELLTKLALARGSGDNISVVVVDLRPKEGSVVV